MFYSQEILSRKSGGFSTIWLLATVGSKSSLKKIQKKEIMSVQISDTCQLIADPPEPLALRLSSNLLFGISQVYNQQYSFFYSEVVSVNFKVLKGIKSMKADKIDKNIAHGPTSAFSKHDREIFTVADDTHFAIDFGLIPPPFQNTPDLLLPDQPFDFTLNPFDTSSNFLNNKNKNKTNKNKNISKNINYKNINDNSFFYPDSFPSNYSNNDKNLNISDSSSLDSHDTFDDTFDSLENVRLRFNDYNTHQLDEHHPDADIDFAFDENGRILDIVLEDDELNENNNNDNNNNLIPDDELLLDTADANNFATSLNAKTFREMVEKDHNSALNEPSGLSAKKRNFYDLNSIENDDNFLLNNEHNLLPLENSLDGLNKNDAKIRDQDEMNENANKNKRVKIDKNNKPIVDSITELFSEDQRLYRTNYIKNMTAALLESLIKKDHSAKSKSTDVENWLVFNGSNNPKTECGLVGNYLKNILIINHDTKKNVKKSKKKANSNPNENENEHEHGNEFENNDNILDNIENDILHTPLNQMMHDYNGKNMISQELSSRFPETVSSDREIEYPRRVLPGDELSADRNEGNSLNLLTSMPWNDFSYRRRNSGSYDGSDSDKPSSDMGGSVLRSLNSSAKSLLRMGDSYSLLPNTPDNPFQSYSGTPFSTSSNLIKKGRKSRNSFLRALNVSPSLNSNSELDFLESVQEDDNIDTPNIKNNSQTQFAKMSNQSIGEEGFEFLEYVSERSVMDNEKKNCFTTFDQVFPLENTNPAVAASALFQVLALITNNYIQVDQNAPYEDIQIQIPANILLHL